MSDIVLSSLQTPYLILSANLGDGYDCCPHFKTGTHRSSQPKIICKSNHFMLAGFRPMIGVTPEHVLLIILITILFPRVKTYGFYLNSDDIIIP